VSLKDYIIQPISNALAMSVVIREHYLHRRAPCSFAFGLFLREELKGVICYGTPSSATLRKGLAGPENISNVIELTRLWVSDDVPKNGESFLIGNTVRKVDKEFVVSFAEIQQGHLGIVYQATNWIYTGLSAKRTNWHVDGDTRHSQSLADEYRTVAELRERFGDQFTLVPRPRKHRYVFFNANRRRRKEMLKELRYPILPYPKNLNTDV
jgi:hypothetical protein